jgi:diacylglycerol kinase family enzyme
MAADILGAEIHGLDTGSSGEFARCAREQAGYCDVLVAAGGDGTFSTVMNAVDLSDTALAFLPFGTGNALSHALHYRGRLTAIAVQIKGGTVHQYDLIECDDRKRAFMVSIGLDGEAIRWYDYYRARGNRGLSAHVLAAVRAYFREYQPAGAMVSIDGEHRRVDRLMSLAVVKQPYFGMGLCAVPRARWDDGYLHTLRMPSGLPGLLAGLVTGFTIGNRVGAYGKGARVGVQLDRPVRLQIDGDMGWIGDRFRFSVAPGVLKLKH